MRALRLHPPGAVLDRPRRGHPAFRGTAGQARPRACRLRHLQAGGGFDPRLLLEPADHRSGTDPAAGHQRPLPRQHAEGIAAERGLSPKERESLQSRVLGEQKERRAKLTGAYDTLSEPEKEKDRQIARTVASNIKKK